MELFKYLIAISIFFTTLNARVDFKSFSNICDSHKTCKNKNSQIKAVKLLLNKRLKTHLTINSKWDSKTKKVIRVIQSKFHIRPTGNITNIKTKIALNTILYGKKAKHTSKTKITSKSKKKTVKKVVKRKIASKFKRKNVKKLIKTTTKKKVVKVAKTKKVIIKKRVAIKNHKNRHLKTKHKTVFTKAKKSKKVLQKIAKHKHLKIPKKSIKKLVKKEYKALHFKKLSLNNYTNFLKSVNLRKSFAIYKDLRLLKIARRARTQLKVDVSQQRIKLIVNGKIALDAPCTTGAKHKLEPNTRTIRDKHTPYGTFRIMEKIALKRSTIFGTIYKHGVAVYHGDRRKYSGSWAGAVFVGHPLKHWMRLTSGGIGLHESKYVKRYPASNGCIRLPRNVASMLFASVHKGTKVRIVY